MTREKLLSPLAGEESGHTAGTRETWRTIAIQQSVLEKNENLAEQNRARFQENHLLVLNIVSSPGSGKTALLERTLTDLRGRLRLGVIVGDLETDNDARRMRGKGAPVIQITTGGICHLDAAMVARALDVMNLDTLDVLIVENVGNLVCPASYDLGEAIRVVLLSVTEGEDKPLKYPVIFQRADVVIVNKVDIAEAVGFDRDAALSHLQRVAPQAHIFEVSARTGQGMDDWYAYLESSVPRRTHL